MGLLNKELDLVKSLSATIASFKEGSAAPVRHNFQEGPPSRDPDVWPPPTPADHTRLLTFYNIFIHVYMYMYIRVDRLSIIVRNSCMAKQMQNITASEL